MRQQRPNTTHSQHSQLHARATSAFFFATLAAGGSRGRAGNVFVSRPQHLENSTSTRRRELHFSPPPDPSPPLLLLLSTTTSALQHGHDTGIYIYTATGAFIQLDTKSLRVAAFWGGGWAVRARAQHMRRLAPTPSLADTLTPLRVAIFLCIQTTNTSEKKAPSFTAPRRDSAFLREPREIFGSSSPPPLRSRSSRRRAPQRRAQSIDTFIKDRPASARHPQLNAPRSPETAIAACCAHLVPFSLARAARSRPCCQHRPTHSHGTSSHRTSSLAAGAAARRGAGRHAARSRERACCAARVRGSVGLGRCRADARLQHHPALHGERLLH